MLTQLDTGDPEIWHALGDASQNGLGIERDVEQAEQWIQKSAEAGHVGAMIRFWHLLRRAEHDPEGLAESIQWYRRASALSVCV